MQLVDMKKLFILGDTIPHNGEKNTVLLSSFYVVDQFCFHIKNITQFQISDEFC